MKKTCHSKRCLELMTRISNALPYFYPEHYEKFIELRGGLNVASMNEQQLEEGLNRLIDYYREHKEELNQPEEQ